MVRGVERSDSLRSDTSRPKVSFNRDVHIKRIGGRQDWKKDVREAEEVLRKVRSVESIAHDTFNSLPRKGKGKEEKKNYNSLARNKSSAQERNGNSSDRSVNSLPRPPKKATVGMGTHSLDRRARPSRLAEPEPNTVRREPKKQQLSPILEAGSAWDGPQPSHLYATVNKSRKKEPATESDGSGGRSNMDEPSERIRRLIGNTEGYLSPSHAYSRRSTGDLSRRHSSPIDRPPSEHIIYPPPTIPAKKKKSLPDKVKSLFSKKKKDQENKDPLSGRYIQYNGYNNNSTKSSKSESPEIKDKDNWFKSIDRRIRRNNSKIQTKVDRKAAAGGGGSSSQEDTDSSWRKRTKSPRPKPLRYFGDTEDESDGIGRVKKEENGYGSNTSSKSVVYLHSPAVVEIPVRRLDRRSQSRDDLSGKLDAGKRTTVSRSVSVLAPWTPRHKPNTIDYSVPPRAKALSADELDSIPSSRRYQYRRNSNKFSSGDETDPPIRPPRRKLVFTGPSFDTTHRVSTIYDNKNSSYDNASKYSSFDNIYKVSRPLSRSTSLYSRETNSTTAHYHGKTRK